MTRREAIKKLLAGSAAVAAGGAFAEEVAAGQEKSPLVKGAIGDPKEAYFGNNVFPLPHTVEDGPSCFLQGGEIVRPAAKIPLFSKVDVVVVGGGAAGFAAAIAAARTGAKTALVERYGSLGGLFTNGMVLLVMCTSAKGPDGKYRFVTKGVCDEFIRRCEALNGSVPSVSERHPESSYWEPTIDPEAAKYVMDQMIAEAGVEMYFHAWGVDVVQDGNAVQGVVFESKQGTQAILARQVVDCTGDGDIFFRAGADYRQVTHAIGSVVRFGNVDRVPKGAARPARPRTAGPWPTAASVDPGGSLRWGSNLGKKGNGLDVRQLSAAEVAHRKFWMEHLAELRKHPDWRETYIANFCSQIGVRTTRILESELIVDRALLRKGNRFPDAVALVGCRTYYDDFQVPYRALIPKKVDNLLAAGRCIGAPDTIETFRLIAPCFITGEAAGTAAALSAKAGCTPRQLDVKVLQKTLTDHNVCLA